MFDIGWSEMAIIMLLALIIIGPKDLPRVARTIGQWVRKGRMLAREFQTSLEDMARETELDDVKKEIEKAGRTDFSKTIEKTIDPKGELTKAFDPSADDEKTAPKTPTLSDQSKEAAKTETAASEGTDQVNGGKTNGAAPATGNGSAVVKTTEKPASPEKPAASKKPASGTNATSKAAKKPTKPRQTAAKTAAKTTATKTTATKTAAAKTAESETNGATKTTAARKPRATTKSRAVKTSTAKTADSEPAAEEANGAEPQAVVAKSS